MASSLIDTLSSMTRQRLNCDIGLFYAVFTA
jgi:hypothetical protein